MDLRLRLATVLEYPQQPRFSKLGLQWRLLGQEGENCPFEFRR